MSRIKLGDKFIDHRRVMEALIPPQNLEKQKNYEFFRRPQLVSHRSEFSEGSFVIDPIV